MVGGPRLSGKSKLTDSHARKDLEEEITGVCDRPVTHRSHGCAWNSGRKKDKKMKRIVSTAIVFLCLAVTAYSQDKKRKFTGFHLPNGNFSEDVELDGIPDRWAVAHPENATLVKDKAIAGKAFKSRTSGKGYELISYDMFVENLAGAKVYGSFHASSVKGDGVAPNGARVYMGYTTAMEMTHYPPVYFDKDGDIIGDGLERSLIKAWTKIYGKYDITMCLFWSIGDFSVYSRTGDKITRSAEKIKKTGQDGSLNPVWLKA